MSRTGMCTRITLCVGFVVIAINCPWCRYC